MEHVCAISLILEVQGKPSKLMGKLGFLFFSGIKYLMHNLIKS